MIYECSNAQPIYWQRIYGLNSYRFSKSAIETFDGGYLILNEGTGTGYSCNLIKTDRFGNVQQERNFFTRTTNDIIQTEDSGFVLVGGGLKASCFKVNKLLDSVWFKEYGSSISDKFVRVKQFSNRDLLLVGYKSISNLTSGTFIVRTNLSGNIIWEKIISDSTYIDIQTYDALIEKNNNIVITGTATSDVPANSDIFIFKLTSNGENYLKVFLYTLPQRESGFRIINSYDGNYIISGGAPSPGICSHFTKTDTSGNLLLQKFYTSCTRFVLSTHDGKYMMGGTIQSEQIYRYGIRKLDSEGNEIWLRILNNGLSKGYLENFINTSDGGFLFAGIFKDTTLKPLDIYSPYVAKTDSEGFANIPVNVIDNQIYIPYEFVLYPAFPNPFNSNVIIKFDILESGNYKLSLFDISGRTVKEIFNSQFKQGKYQINLSEVFSQLTSSIYFIRLSSHDKVFTQKLFLIK